MRSIKGSLDLLWSPAWLGGYLATLIVVLGWSAHRGYLSFFGIDPAGVDGASAETTVNYIGFGFRVVGSYVSLDLLLKATAVLMIWLAIRDLAAVYFSERLARLAQNTWIIITIVFFVVFVRYTFVEGPTYAREFGKSVAQHYLAERAEHFRQVTIESEALPNRTGGCWRKILEDKSNLYLFWDAQTRSVSPSIFIIGRDKVKSINVLQGSNVCF
jgi:hypothetical protein